MWRDLNSFSLGGTAYATDVDTLFIGLLVLTLLITGLLVALIVGFCIKYRASSNADRGDRVRKSWHWEISWTAAAFLAFLGLFAWGAELYVDLAHAPRNALSIYVVAKQWMWKTQHPGGQREINELHVPVDVPVRLVMASQDVIHSFFIPAFRIKQDVVPGRYQALWFEPRKTGVFHLFCAEFCGTDHSRMTGRIVVLDRTEYVAWLSRQQAAGTLASEGAALFRSLGCSGCHEGKGAVRAPPLEGLYGKPVPLADGTVTVADERYIRDSILLPRSEVAAGYEPKMPSFAGKVSEDDLVRLVAYVKSLADAQRPNP